MQQVSDMLIAIAENLPGIQIAVFIIFGVIGIFCIGSGLITQLRNGRSGQPVLPSTFALVITGSFMLSMPALVKVFANTLFGGNQDPRMILSYATTTGTSTDVALQTIVYVIVVIGWVAAGRGLLIWKSGPDTGQVGWFGRGLTFIIGGVLATNIVIFADFLGGSIGQQPFGTNYLDY